MVYKRSSDQILLPSVKTAEPKGPKTGPSFEAAGSSFEVAGSHLVELHQPPIEKPIVSAAELRQSLFLESTSRNTQTDCLLSETELLRERAGSVGQLSTREPFQNQACARSRRNLSTLLTNRIFSETFQRFPEKKIFQHDIG